MSVTPFASARAWRRTMASIDTKTTFIARQKKIRLCASKKTERRDQSLPFRSDTAIATATLSAQQKTSAPNWCRTAACFASPSVSR